MTSFDLNGFLDLFIWVDTFLITWFGLIWRLFKIAWFDLTPFSHDSNWIWNHYQSLKNADSGETMAPMERIRWELSIGVIFVHGTLFLSFYGLILVTPEILIWNQNQITIWFAPEFSPQIMIRFDDSQKHPWLDFIWFEVKSFFGRFDLILICPPLRWDDEMIMIRYDNIS